MTKTLFDLTYEVALLCADVEEGTATGGDTESLIDANDRTEDDNYWNGGVAWILETDDAAAPQGSYSIITDFDNAAGDATLRTTLTAIEAGDYYAITDNEFPLNQLISAINQALRYLGPIPTYDISTITIADKQTEYDLPLNAKRDLRTVEIQTNKDTNDYGWSEIFNWRPQTADAGTQPLLVLNRQYSSGYLLRLCYLHPHGALRTVTDKLSELVPMERVIYRAAAFALLRKKRHTQRKDYDTDIAVMFDFADKMDFEYPLDIPVKPGWLNTFTETNKAYNPGDRTLDGNN